MKKWLIPLIGVTVIVAVTTGAVFALPGDGTPDQEPGLEHPSRVGPLPPIRSDEGIDPDECNQVHNITACNGQIPAGAAASTNLDEVPTDEGDTPCCKVPPPLMMTLALTRALPSVSHIREPYQTIVFRFR